MDNEEREKIKKIAIKKEKLSSLSKVRRVLAEPIRLLPVSFSWLMGIIFGSIKIKHKVFWGSELITTIPGNTILFLKGFYELNLFNFFLNFIKDGDVVVDAGSNEGSYTKLFSKLVGDSGKVYAFEPTPRTFEILKANTKNDKNIIINNFALFNQEKEIIFEDYGPRLNVLNTFKKREIVGLSKPKEIKVQAISLDSYFKRHKIDRCEFIKIDVEGAESIVLEGMIDILDKNKPVISIEVGGGDEWKENNKNSIVYLRNKNYEIFEINDEDFLSRHYEKDSYIYDNLVAVHKDKLDVVKNIIK